MGKVNFSVEQIIIKLREVEVLCGQGQTPLAKQYGTLG